MIARMWLTDEDRKILRFVEDFGSVTIHQTQNMWYNRQTKGYNMAQKHLSKLVSYGKLNCYRNGDFNANMYYDVKKPEFHAVLVLDYYSELIKNGATIILFKREKPWLNKKFYSDAFCCYSIGGKVIFDILEVVRTKNIEVDKYKQIYASDEALNLCQDIYNQLTDNKGGKLTIQPHLIVIDDIKHNKELDVNPSVKVIQLDFKLSKFPILFI